MSVNLKYAVVERERRYLLAGLPDRVTSTYEIVDRYLSGTRLRLRELRDEDGHVTRKLGHKVRLTDGPGEVACTNMYLNEQEWDLLGSVPARLLRKKRHVVSRDGLTIAIDGYDDGTLVAEIDDRDQPAQPVPAWLAVVADVSNDDNGRVPRSRAELQDFRYRDPHGGISARAVEVQLSPRSRAFKSLSAPRQTSVTNSMSSPSCQVPSAPRS